MEWIERAAEEIAEVTGIVDDPMHTIAAIIAAEHERWLCEKLNGLPLLYPEALMDDGDLMGSMVESRERGDYVDIHQLAAALNLECELPGKGLQPKEKP